MRVSARRSCLQIAAAVVTVMGIAGPAVAESSDAIGRLLAERFAEDGRPSTPAGRTHTVEPATRPPAAEEQRMLEELDMLERARAEAESRLQSHQDARGSSPTEPPSVSDTKRREDDERRIAEERRQAAAAARAAEEARRAEDERKAREAELAQMEAEREAEAARIDEALRQARAAREERGRHSPASSHDPVARATPSADAEGDIHAVRSPGTAEPTDRLQQPSWPARPGPEPETGDRWRSETRVTVLMTMEPGNRGIRRHNKTADPLLCGERGCYVGAGADAPAEFLPRRRALGAGRTLGERAGACRNSLGCVFRSVDLIAYPAAVQPIDMRFLRHDRRQPLVVLEPSDCQLSDGRLACTSLQGPDYTMWIVPERLAEAAGPAELERVLEAGLVGTETASR